MTSDEKEEEEEEEEEEVWKEREAYRELDVCASMVVMGQSPTKDWPWETFYLVAAIFVAQFFELHGNLVRLHIGVVLPRVPRAFEEVALLAVHEPRSLPPCRFPFRVVILGLRLELLLGAEAEALPKSSGSRLGLHRCRLGF